MNNMEMGNHFMNDGEFEVEMEYISAIASYLDEMIEIRDDGDYELNITQYRKLIRVLEFFTDLNAEIAPIHLRPKETCGDITAEISVLYLCGGRIHDFCQAMSACSAISIDATVDGKVCISVTIPNVFVEKR